ncbi:MAG: hypothetical protein KA792_01520, partial [Bacteroidales bacterium]|nr:hypothetical protein [Bacteroidales bacterium]
MIVKKITISFLIILITGFIAKAQEQKYNEVVKIIGEYTPTISDAYKINIKPELRDTVIKLPEFNYNIRAYRINTSFKTEPIKPARLTGEPLEELYNSYLKAGFGTQITPYLDFFHNTTRSKEYTAGINFTHFSSNSEKSIKDFGNPAYNFNSLTLFGKKYLDNLTLNAKLQYLREMFHYYGRLNDSLYKENKTFNNTQKHLFSLINFSAGLESNNPDKYKIQPSLNLDFYNFSDNFNTSENNIRFNADFVKDINLVKSAFKQNIKLNLSTDYSNLNSDSIKTPNNALFGIAPELFLSFNNFDFELGFNSQFATQKSDFFIYPVSKLTINLYDKYLYLYAGIKGNNEINHLKDITEENPFVKANFGLKNTEHKYDCFGGFKGKFNNNVGFNLYSVAAQSKNMLLFVNDTLKGNKNKFTVLFDDAKIVQAVAELSVKNNNVFEILFNFNYYVYNMNKEKKAWYKP